MKGTGNQQDYGMRIYDPRVGRFLSVDPLTKEYPELTPYQFASNTPIESIDLDGLERAPAGKTKYGQPLESTAAVYYHKPVNEIIADSEEIERKKAQAFMAAMQQKRETVSAAKPSETKHVSELNRPARERIYDDQGYLPNGKKKLGTELAENKTFQKFDENIVQPTFLVSGGVELFQLGRFGFRQMVAKEGVGLFDDAAGVLSKGDYLRIQNAATRINKPITVVGSRAKGTAGAYSDWDYVIQGLNNNSWKKIKNSLPGSRSVLDNTPRNIDIFKTLDPTKPHIIINPR